MHATLISAPSIPDSVCLDPLEGAITDLHQLRAMIFLPDNDEEPWDSLRTAIWFAARAKQQGYSVPGTKFYSLLREVLPDSAAFFLSILGTERKVLAALASL